MLRYALTPGDRAIVERVARARSRANRSQGVGDARVQRTHAPERLDLQGFAGELAFCRLMNLRPDESIEPRSKRQGSDADADARLSDGRTVDVKTPLWNTPTTKLLVQGYVRKEDSADLFALMLGSWEEGSYRLAGFMSKDELMRPARLRSMRAGLSPSFAAEQHELLAEINND